MSVLSWRFRYGLHFQKVQASFFVMILLHDRFVFSCTPLHDLKQARHAASSGLSFEKLRISSTFVVVALQAMWPQRMWCIFSLGLALSMGWIWMPWWTPVHLSAKRWGDHQGRMWPKQSLLLAKGMHSCKLQAATAVQACTPF